jgi:SAM-dependent methyltransferase
MAILLDVTLALDWESATPAGTVRHRDCLFAPGLDPERDRLPDGTMARLAAASPGESVEQDVTAAGLAGADPGAIFDLPAEALSFRTVPGGTGRPRYGLYYPSTIFRLPPERQFLRTVPVRYLGTADGAMTLDSRHPLADHRLRLSATVLRAVEGSSADRPSIDWGYRLSSGPGMQACWRGTATDYLYDGAYLRPDEAADGQFYDMPRIVAHIDRRAQAVLGDYYAAIIPPDGRVLDLMSSAHSNLLPGQSFGALVGLGMNAAEMRANDRLTHALVADLNTGTALPFADCSFDAAICTVSIDYLTDPAGIVREVGRVLRPGAAFALTWSNRWFPPKVTRLWTELTPYEQTGLVVSYFTGSGQFDRIETASFRGLPRPPDDDYAGYTDVSDPIFAVSGYIRS